MNIPMNRCNIEMLLQISNFHSGFSHSSFGATVPLLMTYPHGLMLLNLHEHLSLFSVKLYLSTVTIMVNILMATSRYFVYLNISTLQFFISYYFLNNP